MPYHARRANPFQAVSQFWSFRHRPLGEQVCATLAAGGADEIRFDGRQSDVIGPAVSADRGRAAAFVVAAIDQHIANAVCAHFAECDFFRVGRHVVRQKDYLEISAGWRTAMTA
jgi:hypothetical protein